MRYILLTLLLFPLLNHAQDNIRIISKYENFSAATGKVYKTETKEIRKIRDIIVSLVKTTDVESKKSITAVQISQKSISVFSPNELGIVYIDMDELPGVSDAFKYFQSQTKGGKPQNQLSSIYVTTNKIPFNCAYTDGGSTPGWFVTITQPYHPKNTGGGAATIKNKEIDEMADALSQAKSTNF